jgi:RHS repeat-associated protein
MTGNTVSSGGTMAEFFSHRFSTKYWDPETDLYYYGHRFYSPR